MKNGIYGVGVKCQGKRLLFTPALYPDPIYYEVLSAHRPLTIGMIRKLNKGLGIPVEVLIKEYKVA